MCSNVANAAPQTHSTIVATLVIPSGTGAIIVPTATVTKSIITSSPTPPRTSSLDLTLSISSTPTTSLETSPASATSSSPPSAASTTSRLTNVQIAGISIGVAATVALAIGLIFLARCVRRRRFGDQESSLMRTSRGSRGFGLLKSSQNSPQLQISAPISKTPVEMDFRRPGDRESILPSAIGLAISPPPSVASASMSAANTAHYGRSQRYTPEAQQAPALPKPALTLTIPQESEQQQQQQPARRESRMASTNRESVVTEFAEDGEQLDSAATGPRVWRPPPSDPQSATTYYVADKWGNWTLGSPDRRSQAAELEVPGRHSMTRAERARDALPESPVEGTANALPVPPKPTVAKLGSPIAFRDKSTASGFTMSPSVYSTNFSTPPSIALPSGSNPMPKNLPPPSTYFDLMRKSSTADRRGSTHRRKSRRASRADRRISSGSATTIESASGELDDEDMIDDEPQEGMDLSPVEESPPCTPISPGTSPVSYPPIPGSRQSTPQKGAALSLFPSPLRTSVSNPYGHQNPTIRAVEPVKSHRTPSPNQVPRVGQSLNPGSLNPNHNYNPSKIRTGSPEVRAGPSAPRQQQQQQQRRPSPAQQASSNLRVDTASGQRPMHHRVDSAQTLQSAESYNSNASSLLAKRLGADRAAALALGGGAAGPSKPSKWKRDGGNGQGAPGFVTDGGHVPLPSTPGWLPKLTPTRRGDDLFLNVQ